MIEDWIDEHPFLGVALGIALILALSVGLVAWADKHDQRIKDAACAKMWAASRTSADTIAVLARCELPQESNTVVAPVPVFIPVR